MDPYAQDSAVRKLEALVRAVSFRGFSGIELQDVDGVNWLDARDALLATAAPQNALSSADLLFGFGGWLTGMDGSYTVGAAHDAAPMANLVASFLVSQELPTDTSSGFPDNLQTYPPTPPEHLALATAAPQPAPEPEGLREAARICDAMIGNCLDVRSDSVDRAAVLKDLRRLRNALARSAAAEGVEVAPRELVGVATVYEPTPDEIESGQIIYCESWTDLEPGDYDVMVRRRALASDDGEEQADG